MVFADLLTVSVYTKKGIDKFNEKLDDVRDIDSLDSFQQRFTDILEKYLNKFLYDGGSDEIVRILNDRREEILSSISKESVGDRDKMVNNLLDSITYILNEEFDGKMKSSQLRDAVETAYKNAIDEFIKEASEDDRRKLRTELAVDIQDELEEIKQQLIARPELYTEVAFNRIYPKKNHSWEEQFASVLELEELDISYSELYDINKLISPDIKNVLLVGWKGGGKTRTLYEGCSRFVKQNNIDTVAIVTSSVSEPADLLNIANEESDEDVLLIWDDIQKSTPESDIRKSLMQLISSFENKTSNLYIRATVRRRDIDDVLPEERGLSLLEEPVDPSSKYAVWQKFDKIELSGLQEENIEPLVQKILNVTNTDASDSVIKKFINTIKEADPTPFYILSVCQNAGNELTMSDISTLPENAVESWNGAFEDISGPEKNILRALKITDKIEAVTGKALVIEIFVEIYGHNRSEFEDALNQLEDLGWVQLQPYREQGIPSNEIIAIHDVRLEAIEVDFDVIHEDIKNFLLNKNRILRGDRGATANTTYAKKIVREEIGYFPIEHAEKHYERALDQNHETPHVHVAYARFLTDEKDYEKAEEQWQQAVQQNEDYRWIYATWLRKQERITNAIKEYEKGLDAETDSITTLRFSYADLLTEENEIERALEVYEEGLKQNPDSSLFAFRESYFRLLKREDHTEKAIEVLKQGLGHETGDMWYRKRLSDLLKKEGRKNEAISILNEGLSQKPENNILRRRLANLVEEQVSVNKAIEVYNEGIRNGTESVDLREELARLYEQKGDKGRAIDTYKEGIEHNPKYRPFWEKLALLLSEKEDLDELIQIYRERLETVPLDSWFRRSFVDLLEQCGEHDHAQEIYEDGLKVHPNDVCLRSQYIDYLARQKKYEKAISEYKIAISHGMQPSEKNTCPIESCREISDAVGFINHIKNDHIN